MVNLKELYENPIFSNAMKNLTEEQKKQTEKDIADLLHKIENSILLPLAKEVQKIE